MLHSFNGDIIMSFFACTDHVKGQIEQHRMQLAMQGW